jgi:ATP-dependent DNA ligase
VLKKFDVVLDGEVCLENGTIHQINRKENWAKAVFIVFDILSINGNSITEMPLKYRLEILEHFVKTANSEFVKLPMSFNSFVEAWAYVKEHNKEGVVAKDLGSRYIMGKKWTDKAYSYYWVKIKNWNEQDVVFNTYEQKKDGITLTDGFHRVSLKTDVERAKNTIEKKGKLIASVRYIYKTDDGHLFHPSILKFGVSL